MDEWTELIKDYFEKLFTIKQIRTMKQDTTLEHALKQFVEIELLKIVLNDNNGKMNLHICELLEKEIDSIDYAAIVKEWKKLFN